MLSSFFPPCGEDYSIENARAFMCGHSVRFFRNVLTQQDAWILFWASQESHTSSSITFPLFGSLQTLQQKFGAGLTLAAAKEIHRIVDAYTKNVVFPAEPGSPACSLFFVRHLKRLILSLSHVERKYDYCPAITVGLYFSLPLLAQLDDARLFFNTAKNKLSYTVYHDVVSCLAPLGNTKRQPAVMRVEIRDALGFQLSVSESFESTHFMLIHHRMCPTREAFSLFLRCWFGLQPFVSEAQKMRLTSSDALNLELEWTERCKLNPGPQSAVVNFLDVLAIYRRSKMRWLHVHFGWHDTLSSKEKLQIARQLVETGSISYHILAATLTGFTFEPCDFSHMLSSTSCILNAIPMLHDHFSPSEENLKFWRGHPSFNIQLMYSDQLPHLTTRMEHGRLCKILDESIPFTHSNRPSTPL
jgi:hypothetical protein